MGLLLKAVRVLSALAVIAMLAFFALVVAGVFMALDAATAAYASPCIVFTC